MAEAFPSTFLLEIVTPHRLLLSEQVSEVIAPGVQGYFGVLPGHVPFVSSLTLGELIYRKGQVEHHLAILWGYAEVLPDRVVIIAEHAETPEEIDLTRAEAAKERALERIKGGIPGTDFPRADLALRRALLRLRVGSKKR